MIVKPLLAWDAPSFDKIKFPVLATPKIDGHRAFRKGDTLLSRSGKPIQNVTIRRILTSLLPEGADGEIIAGVVFQDVSSAVNSSIGSIHYGDPFTFYWFDWVKDDPKKPYVERMKDVEQYLIENPEVLQHKQAKIIPLLPILIQNADELKKYETKMLDSGAEGVMIRKPDGIYKMNRSTAREAILLKVKRMLTSEAKIIGFSESVQNTNEAYKNEVGSTKRSTKKDGMVKQGKLGSFIVEKDGVEFKVAGFTEDMKTQFWLDKEKLLGKYVEYKYFPIGMKDKPRHPIFLRFRHEDDMSLDQDTMIRQGER